MMKMVIMCAGLMAATSLLIARPAITAPMLQSATPAQMQEYQHLYQSGMLSPMEKELVKMYVVRSDERSQQSTLDDAGGPDGFGYYWDNSVPYNWIELAVDPSAHWVGAGEWTDPINGYAGPYPISFSFPYYGMNFTQFWIGTNGHINFDSGSACAGGGNCVPHSYSCDGHGIDVFDADLHTGNGPEGDPGHVVVWRDFGSYLVVEYYNIGQLGPANLFHYTFEVILYPNGHIRMQYGTLVGSFYDNGYETVGIQQDDITGPGLSYFCTYGDQNPVAPGVAVLFGLDDILAVELSSFTAIPGDGRVTLNWTTASEADNDHFELVRDGAMVAQLQASNRSAGSSYTWTDVDVSNGTTYNYALVAVDANGYRNELGTVNARPSYNAAVIREYALHQNYPNPFNPTTSITFDLVESGDVTLEVYNLMGQRVASLMAGMQEAGRHTVSFDAANLPSGEYVYQLKVNGFTAAHKMVLMK
jgi:hypothetical protein